MISHGEPRVRRAAAQRLHLPAKLVQAEGDPSSKSPTIDWPPLWMAKEIPSPTKEEEEEDRGNSASPSFPRSPPPLSLPLRMEEGTTAEEGDYPRISSLDELNSYDGAVIAKVREKEEESVVKMEDGGGGDQVEGNLVTIVCDGSIEGQTKCRTKSIPSSSTKSNYKSASSSAQKRSRRSEDSATKRNNSAEESPTPTKPTKRKIHWRDSGLTGLNAAFNPGRSYVPPSPLSPGVMRSTLPPEIQRERETREFYRNYDPMEGVVTAVVLGGFFAFVCLLVVYKTKCKPMWKNRRKRLHNTPATRSVADNDMGKGELGVVADLATEEGGGDGIMDEQEVVVGIGEPMECCDGVDYDYDEDEDDYLDEEYEYECIPLRSVFSGVEGGGGYVEGGGGTAADGDEESDMYFLDEFGNYVFPVMAPSMPGSCLCHPHEEEEPDPSMSMAAAFRRRQSQGSAISNAYTVKSLPGAYLYIPLLASAAGAGAGGEGRIHHHSDAFGAGAGSVVSVSSLASVRRSLSDPEIHFAPPFGHPVILTVNPSSDNIGNNSMVPMHGLLPPRKRQRHKLQQRSHSMQPDTTDSRATQEFTVGRTLRSNNDAAVNDVDDDVAIEGIIAIQIIQPTPNISPTCSLKSVDDDDVPPGLGEQQPLLTSSSPSPTSSLKRKKPRHNKVDRRVSFSDDSMDQDDGSGDGTSANYRASPSHRAIVQQQMQVGGAAPNIPFMNYLQVPGQQPTIQFVAPQMTQEARQAQTSPQARRRRATRLMKAGSFCSITSDGDGDIFGPTGELLLPSGKTDKRPSLTPSQASKQSSADSSGDTSGNTTQKSTFDLSDYTELHLDDCRSDISDLFAKNDEDDDTKGELKNQNTLSEQGSIKSLSTDEDEKEVTVMTGEEDRTEPTVVVSATAGVRRQRRSSPPYNNPEYDEIMRHHATVTTPMGDEEGEEGEDMYASSSCSVSIGSDNNAERQNRNQDHRITVPVTIEHPPPEMREEGDEEGAEQASDSGQENRPASISASLRVETGSPQRLEEVVLPTPPSDFTDPNTSLGESGEGPVMTEDPEEEVVRLVLVRDIGVQVCGDSPNLNSTRRFPHHRIMPPPRPINVTSDLYPAPPPPLIPMAPPSSAPPSSLSGSLAGIAPSSAPASMTESSFVSPSTLTRRHHRSAGSAERDNSEESFPTEILF